MKTAPVVLLCTAAALIIAYPSTALSTPDIGAKHNGWALNEERYLETYEDCWDAFASRCGANLVDDNRSDPLPDARVNASTERMQNWLNPPKPEPTVASSTYVSDVAPSTPVATSVAPAPVSSGGCPSYMAAEASSPDAVNPSSGAAGCWQVTPGTAAAMGSACSDVNATSCLGAICAAQGNAAWSASGATPCDYIKP